MTGHAAAVLHATSGPALPDAMTIPWVEFAALIRVFNAAVDVAGTQPYRETFPALHAALASAPPRLRTRALKAAVNPAQRYTADEQAELRASGLACQPAAMGGGHFIVASGSEPGKSYDVRATDQDWPAWECSCQGGRPGNRCQHKRRARQEVERRARRAERKAKPAQWSQHVTHNRAPR